MLLEEIYTALRRQHLCTSAYDFSVNYLGKSPSYFSVLKARNDKPSIEAIVTLEMALHRRANLYGSSHPFLIQTREKLIELENEVASYRARCINAKLSCSQYA